MQIKYVQVPFEVKEKSKVVISILYGVFQYWAAILATNQDDSLLVCRVSGMWYTIWVGLIPCIVKQNGHLLSQNTYFLMFLDSVHVIFDQAFENIRMLLITVHKTTIIMTSFSGGFFHYKI